jgi:hypothetical protein
MQNLNRAGLAATLIAAGLAASHTNGAVRHWASVDESTPEVGNARVWGGLHLRTATEVANAMGRQIGDLAAAKLPRPVD